ncbi:hypothetical protein M404DRAFT_23876 [Pisolithus tinctorius Marx 270]|uniref:Uncharacterized protein n=1 Tax=Pisolithus tinctorius Marx 270 TaxID=870435 RepID=A0A0C3KCR0_PISTI|nr:hypothetical protein M404DRAFT_23876 [Pisolithus tinctorius Marx 270]
MSIHQSRTPYDQDLLPDLTQVMSEELQVGNNDQAIWGKLAKCKRHKAKAQEEAWLEAERQEQAWLEEEKAHAEAAHKAEEARKAEQSWQADALVGVSTGAGSNVEMNPQCLCCTQMNTTCLCNTNGKKKHLACNQCNKPKEHCQWPVKGETSQGASSAVNKGKRKANMTSPHTGKKKKRLQKLLTKVIEGADNEEVEMIAGPLKKAGTEVEAGLVTGAQMEHLIKAVKHVADNVASLAVVQKEVLRNIYQFAWSYETYVKEWFKFLVLDMPSDWDTTDEEDRNIEGLDEELEGLREEGEESWSWSESGDQTGASSAGSQV